MSEDIFNSCKLSPEQSAHLSIVCYAAEAAAIKFESGDWTRDEVGAVQSLIVNAISTGAFSATALQFLFKATRPKIKKQSLEDIDAHATYVRGFKVFVGKIGITEDELNTQIKRADEIEGSRKIIEKIYAQES